MPHRAFSPEVEQLLESMVEAMKQRLEDGEPTEQVIREGIREAFSRTYPLLVEHLAHTRGR